jgi:DNA-binding NtrC family response regulator
LRPVATAAVSLTELAAAGEFHAELAALLSTVVIELPPLAERREDLPLLAQALVEDVNVGSQRQLRGFSSEALDRLDGYPWPGNVDELVEVVTEAHGKAEGPEIGVADLPKRIALAQAAAAHPRRREEQIVLDDYLRQIERELVSRAMAQAKGNKAKAARLLGVSRPRLYRRMVQLGLEEESLDETESRD